VLARFQGVWNGDAETCQNPLFQATFWGFLGFSEEEKGPQITKLENFIYSTFYLLINPDNFSLVKFFQKCLVWEIASFAKNSKSGEIVKRTKLQNSILL
jgi:hypothetical protein